MSGKTGRLPSRTKTCPVFIAEKVPIGDKAKDPYPAIPITNIFHSLIVERTPHDITRNRDLRAEVAQLQRTIWFHDLGWCYRRIVMMRFLWQRMCQKSLDGGLKDESRSSTIIR